MADPKLVEILLQGSEAWNRWRKQKPFFKNIDLNGADLNHIDLSFVDLSSTVLSFVDLSSAILNGADMHCTNLCATNLNHADLSNADLTNANLRNANFSHANLSYTKLRRAKLSDTNLAHANLIHTDLTGAELIHAFLNDANLRDADLCTANMNFADLRFADLSGATLNAADLSRTSIGGTIFTRVDLRMVKGLTEIDHLGPSHISLHSIQLPPDGSALHFLRGTGVPNEWIDLYRATMMHPIQYHSCFISYSSKDDLFARHLHAYLQDKGVRCWFAPHDMKIGDKIRSRIDEAIHLQDKLLLILSKDSVTSDWVEHEVETALARECKEKRTILFPIRLDNTILEREHTGWAALVQHERHIGDFTHWTDPQAYEQAFVRLLSDLRTQK